MRIQLAVFSVFAVAIPVITIGTVNLSWRGWLLVAILTTAVVGFSTLLSRTPPSGVGLRSLVYICAVIATQGHGIMNAVLHLVDPTLNDAQPTAPTPWGAILRLFACGLSVSAFILVRRWVSRGIREQLPRKQDASSRWTRYTRPSGIALIAMSGALFAVAPREAILALTGASLNSNMHPRAGEAQEWLTTTASGAIAGVAEEPVFVGIAVLLFPAAYRSWRSFVLVAVLTSFARTLLHVYYVSGQTHVFAGLAAEFIWCAAWSTLNLGLLYWGKSLIPIIVGHGLHNIFMINMSDGWELNGFWFEAVATVELAVILGVTAAGLSYICTYVWSDVSAAQRRKAGPVPETGQAAAPAPPTSRSP